MSGIHWPLKNKILIDLETWDKTRFCRDRQPVPLLT
jgi:hypothetical protein